MDVNVDVHAKQCRFCIKEFTQKCHCTRHAVTCRKKLEYLSYLEKELEKKNNVRGIQNNINNVTNNNNNNTTININVNSLGQENWDYISKQALKQIWSDAQLNLEQGVVETIKTIHANRSHPENHNIIYKNSRSTEALVKGDNGYEYRNINEILKQVCRNTLDMINFQLPYELPQTMISCYDRVCENDELNPRAKAMAKTVLYNGYKSGDITIK